MLFFEGKCRKIGNPQKTSPVYNKGDNKIYGGYHNEKTFINYNDIYHSIKFTI